MRFGLAVLTLLLFASITSAQQYCPNCQPTVTVYQPRTVWVPQQYNVTSRVEFRQSWLFPRLYRRRVVHVWTPITRVQVK